MRLSTNPNDPDYKPDLAARAKIRFNGYEVERVIEADEERGFIVQAMADQNGNIITRNGEVATVRRFGGVQVILPASYSDHAVASGAEGPTGRAGIEDFFDGAPADQERILERRRQLRHILGGL